MKIGLFLGQLGLRGTDQFVLQLADVCERELSHSVIIITRVRQTLGEDVTVESQNAFRSRFFTVFKHDHETLDDIVVRYGIDVCYISKWGNPDGLVTYTVPCIVHAIFDCYVPHGDAYVAISDHMRRKCGVACGVLPFCVELLPQSRSLRQEIGIPQDAFVFGRHGGFDQFDVPFVQEAVRGFSRPDVFMVFMNTRPFMPSSSHVVFLPGDAALQARSDFVHACDAMLHGRSDGETFGMACGEFSLAGKPVLTTRCGGPGARGHPGTWCVGGRQPGGVHGKHGARAPARSRRATRRLQTVRQSRVDQELRRSAGWSALARSRVLLEFRLKSQAVVQRSLLR